MPVYNNATVLPLTLEALFAQRLPADWQVRLVVADDGSTDDSVSLVTRLSEQAGWSVVVAAGHHVGPGSARNRALAQAHGWLVFLLGADIILRPGAVAAHLEWHEYEPDERVAALGLVQWDPRLRPSPLMEWLVHGGPQNDFDALLGTRWADPAHFWYGSHLSCKRALLGPAPFATAFAGYGWEDLELGRRLRGQGVRLRVVESARSLHHHAYSVAMVARRQYQVGFGLVAYQRLHPAAALLSPFTWRRRFKYWLGRLSGADAAVRWLVARDWWGAVWQYSWLTALSFWRGVRAARRAGPP